MIHPEHGAVQILDKCHTDQGGLIQIETAGGEVFWVRTWQEKPRDASRKRQDALRAPRKSKRISREQEIISDTLLVPGMDDSERYEPEMTE
jgi:hypothetical protein